MYTWEKEPGVGFSWSTAFVIAECLLVAGEATAGGWSAAVQEGSIARKSEARIPVTRYYRAQRKEESNLGQSSPRGGGNDQTRSCRTEPTA